MITTTDLVDTIRAANGESAKTTRSRIDKAAHDLGVTPVDGSWYDDDADEICIAVQS